jgi:hypothetical protein
MRKALVECASEAEARDLQLSYVWERLEEVRRLAVIGQDFAALSNEVGMRYALRQAVIQLRSACETFKQPIEPREVA